MPKEQISITLDEELLEELEDERGMVPRSTFIESLIRKGLGTTVELKEETYVMLEELKNSRGFEDMDSAVRFLLNRGLRKKKSLAEVKALAKATRDSLSEVDTSGMKRKEVEIG